MGTHRPFRRRSLFWSLLLRRRPCWRSFAPGYRKPVVIPTEWSAFRSCVNPFPSPELHLLRRLFLQRWECRQVELLLNGRPLVKVLTELSNKTTHLTFSPVTSIYQFLMKGFG